MPASRSIVPVADVPLAVLDDYLRGSTNHFRKLGGNSAAMVRWKYYDDAFNRGRDRGFAWMKDGRVCGFVGTVPASQARGGEVAPLDWTCDWGLLDPQATPGMGILLLRRVTSSSKHVATMGGNATTRSLVPRLATASYEGAGLHFWRPLRSAALLHLASPRVRVLDGLATGALGRVPIPSLFARSGRRVRRGPGVAPRLGALLEAAAPDAWTARYDVPYLQWALERCPGIASGSCYVDGERAPVAGAVYWYATAAPVRHVRFALWTTPDADDAALEVVADVIRQARAQGGALVSTLVGKWDARELAVVRRAGLFPRPGPLPLYLFSSDERLGGLSYLATDLAQRFRAAD